jgi:hypothetical protein
MAIVLARMRMRKSSYLMVAITLKAGIRQLRCLLISLDAHLLK